jgi:hypothetical protein
MLPAQTLTQLSKQLSPSSEHGLPREQITTADPRTAVQDQLILAAVMTKVVDFAAPQGGDGARRAFSHPSRRRDAL